MQDNLEIYWHELEERYAGAEGVYRRLDLEKETGIRMAVLSPGPFSLKFYPKMQAFLCPLAGEGWDSELFLWQARSREQNTFAYAL
ncbi:hypothetical protein [Methanothrix soehngenii]